MNTSKNTKRILLITALAVSIGILVWLAVAHSTAPAKGEVVFDNPSNIPVSIYQVPPSQDEEDEAEPVKVGDSTKSETMSLTESNYCLAIESDDYSKDDAICFDIDKDKPAKVTIDPNYSTGYLAELLPEEQPTVRNIVTKAYKEIISNYKLSDDRLFLKGQWYGLSLTQKVPDPSDRGDVYLLILKKTNRKWSIVDIPRLAVNKYQLPDVPISVLDEVNRFPGKN